MRLKRAPNGDGYVTDDGLFEVSKAPAYTECENPHPVQVGREARDEIRKLYSLGEQQRAMRKYGRDAFYAVLDGKRGYYCDGGAEHWRDSWGVWDVERDDYVDGANDFDTKREAVEHLEDYYRRMENESR